MLTEEIRAFGRGRLERSAQVIMPKSTNQETETSKKNEDTKNGCPKDFERLSDYLCLHLHKDADGNGIQSSFEKSKKYCAGKDTSASVLQFVNAEEASTIWKWLGNIKGLSSKEADAELRLLNQFIS